MVLGIAYSSVSQLFTIFRTHESKPSLKPINIPLEHLNHMMHPDLGKQITPPLPQPPSGFHIPAILFNPTEIAIRIRHPELVPKLLIDRQRILLILLALIQIPAGPFHQTDVA